MKNLILIITSLTVLPAMANTNLYTVDESGKRTTQNIPKWCKNQKLGFSFYCDWEKLKKTDKTKQKQSPPQTPYPETAKVLKQRKELEEALSNAINNPTLENMIDYMKKQQQMQEKATAVAKLSQKALLADPSLDYTLKRPQGKLAKEVWYDERNKDIADIMQEVSQHYGIFFFYKSDCPYSVKYAPIIRSYSNKYRIKTVAVSVDGGKIPYWSNFVVNRGQRELWDVDPTVPATVLYNNKTKTVVPIGYGVLTQTEISERILTILNEERVNDW